MEVKPGFKQTEFGVIPEDWEVRPLGQLGAWKGGATPSMQNSAFWANGTIPWVSSGDVKRPLLSDTPMRITSHAASSSSTTLLPVDSIIVVTRSGILRKHLPVARITAPMAVNQDIKALIPTGHYVSDYLLNLLTWSGPRILASCLKSGTTVESIEFRWLKSFEVALPPTKTEQEAVVEVLSDADALIESLEKLRIKKRHLKQGAMQELLTGKQRLPGFSGEWTMKRLGDLGATYGGLTGKAKSDFGVGSAKYIPFMNVIGNVVIDPNDLEHVRVSDSEHQNRARKGDLFFNGSSETSHEVGLCAALLENLGQVYLNSFCFGFRFHKGAKADGLFLAYFFRSGAGRELLYSLAQGATRYNLSKSQFLKLTLEIPEPEEQSRIALVLSDMEAEIAALKEQVTKVREVKQGMMQELLTGRIRLV